jgi:hypothetical protein
MVIIYFTNPLDRDKIGAALTGRESGSEGAVSFVR